MGVLYQLTFFLALAVLAILITIFVFAVSLLGRALEVASKEQEKTTREQKDAAEKEIAAIQKQISNLRKKGRIDKEKLEELEAKLKQLRKQDERFEKKLSRIGKAPQLLTVKGGVLPPASWLLGALILTAGAWGLSETQNFVPVTLWILSLSAIGYSILRIYRSLRVIESVAITSEAESERRLAGAVKAALIEVEEERKTKLALLFEDEQPPFHIEAGAQMTIKFELSLTQGDLARKPKVYFFAPSDFDFPSERTWLQYKAVTTVGGYITSVVELAECRRGITPVTQIVLKAPSDQGNFSLMYRVTCEGFASDLKQFEVVVEEPEEPDIPF